MYLLLWFLLLWRICCGAYHGSSCFFCWRFVLFNDVCYVMWSFCLYLTVCHIQCSFTTSIHFLPSSIFGRSSPYSCGLHTNLPSWCRSKEIFPVLMEACWVLCGIHSLILVRKRNNPCIKVSVTILLSIKLDTSYNALSASSWWSVFLMMFVSASFRDNNKVIV